METKGPWSEQCGAEAHHYRLDVWFTGTYTAEMGPDWQEFSGTYDWEEDFLYYEIDQETGECESEHPIDVGGGEWRAELFLPGTVTGSVDPSAAHTIWFELTVQG